MSVKFEAGSYPYGGDFVCSIGRYQEENGEWLLSMVLINIDTLYDSVEEAAKEAQQTIMKAHQSAIASNGKESIDGNLSAMGYARLEEERV